MTTFEEFAADRGRILMRADEALLPVVEKALDDYGQDDWYDPVLNEAEELFGDIYARQGGPRRGFDAALETFNEDLGEALEKTTNPTEASAARISTWVSTFTHNAAVAAASPGERLVWTTRGDADVRDAHRAADGQVRTVGTAFDVGGAQMMYPGDFSLGAPPDLVLGCRCLALVEGSTMGTEFALDDEIDDPPIEEMPDGGDELDWDVPTWHGVLAPEGAPSGDGRTFGVDSITSRDLPLPLRWVRADMGHHDGAVVVGNITDIWRDSGLIKAQGTFRTDSPEADEVIGMIATDMLRGVSVDLDDVEFEVDDAPDLGDVGPLSEVPVTLTKGRISAATLVDVPAFSQASVALGSWDDEETKEWSLVAACLPCERAAELAEIMADPPPEVPEEKIEVGDRCMWGDGMVGTVKALDGDMATVVPDDTGIPEQVPVSELRPFEEKAPGDNDSGDGYAAKTEQFREYTPDQRKEMADKGWAMPSGEFPIADEEDLRNAIQAIGRANDPAATRAHIIKRAKALGLEELIPDEWTASSDDGWPEDEFAANRTEQFAPGTKDGPGWLSHPKQTQRLRNYWVHGKGAAKIRWGVPGDFARCRTQLAKYVNPLYLSGTCSNMHKEALGVWPGQEGPGRHSADTQAFVIASAATEATLPADAFANPNLTGPTPITVSADGRISGHLAVFGTCHLSVDRVCTTAPTSPTNYAYFRTGAVLTDQGEIPVGQITMATGHADMSATARATASHYDTTGTAVADVAAGEDEHGIWVAGMLRDGLTAAQVRELRGAALSGDWRRIGGNLELVAALAVNVPGFPIPRIALAASGGVQTSLVAAGAVAPTEVVEGVDIRAEVRAALAEIEKERATATALAAARATLRAVRAADARAALRN